MTNADVLSKLREGWTAAVEAELETLQRDAAAGRCARLAANPFAMRGEAVKRAADRYPELHREYLREHNAARGGRR